jgi:hypothetical protein
VACPACEAQPEQRCRGARGKEREANHSERVDAALASMPVRRSAQQERWEETARVDAALDAMARGEHPHVGLGSGRGSI